MKRVIFLFLVFAGSTFGSCRRQTVMPQFDIVVTDTVAVRGGIPCRFQYAFTSIANADEAPALQAIQESNMLYFFGLEHFQGGVQENRLVFQLVLLLPVSVHVQRFRLQHLCRALYDG